MYCPLWVVFATQIFLDIHHIMRDQIDRGFGDLQESGSLMVKSIQDNLDFHQNLRTDNWPKQNDKSLVQMQEELRDWCQRDYLQKLKMRRCAPQLAESFRLLRWHPLFCGLLVYRFKISFQEAGLLFAGAWGSTMLHLYNALQQEKLLTNKWKDMDLVRSCTMTSLSAAPQKHRKIT